MDESSLIVYTYEARVAYQVIIWPIVVVGVIGNVLVLWRASFGAGTHPVLKPIYRGSVMTLATSDLLILASSGYNVLANVISPVVTWTLPDWACSLLPCVQTTAVLSSSLTLAVVAMERYRTIKPVYPAPTGPSWPMTILAILIVWGISIGATYPVYDLYTTQSIIVVTSTSYYRTALCVTTDRAKTARIYAALFVVIFVPLTTVFIGVHVLLALQIRNRSHRLNEPRSGTSSDSRFPEATTASTSVARTSPVVLRRAVSSLPVGNRKKRTVNVIRVIILIFAICKLPMWSFTLVKLYTTLSGGIWWHVQACVTILSLFNAAVNPFLYTFLNETLSVFSWIRSCWVTTNEADLNMENAEKSRRHVASIKVPRGPYSP